MNAITDLKQEFAPAMRVLPKLLEARAAQFGDAPLFSCGDLHLSYRDMQQAAARVAGALMGAGIATGDRVAILCSNRAEFMPLFLGCGWMGAVSVPINTASRGFQLQHILSNSGAKLLVIEDSLLDVLDGLDLGKLDIARLWVIGGGALPDLPGMAVEHLPQSGTEAEPAPLRPDSPLTILYTSGTTGPSKGVVCPHAQFFWWGVYTGHMLGSGGAMCCTRRCRFSIPMRSTASSRRSCMDAGRWSSRASRSRGSGRPWRGRAPP